MADMEVKVDMSELDRFTEQLEQLSESVRAELCDEAVKDLGKRMMAKVVKTTPVGQYPAGSGKVGGTLRRGWTTGQLMREGDGSHIEVQNDVQYAPYVEFGHRKRGGRGWVEGQFMMTRSAEELDQEAPGIVEARVEKYLGGLK